MNLHSSRESPLLISKYSHLLCIIPQNSSNPIIAYIRITNKTNIAMFNNGIIALIIEFKTTCRPFGCLKLKKKEFFNNL